MMIYDHNEIKEIIQSVAYGMIIMMIFQHVNFIFSQNFIFTIFILRII
jgi:hypothetical protein